MKQVVLLRKNILISFILLFLQANTDAQEMTPGEPASRLDGVLVQRLDLFRKVYPDIMFVNMKGGEDLIANMMTLDILLGHQPSSLDYEHPAELREDLMLASAGRVLDMLKTLSPSASLFRADDPLGWPENICALTINTRAVAADSVQATKNLLAMPHEFVEGLPCEMQLPAEDYLVFVIDHEVYHCLQSLYEGPQSMSDKVLWGEYHHYLNELGADAYAMLMHIRDKGQETPFIKNVQRIRGTALATADPNHLTWKAADKVLEIPSQDIAAMNVEEIFNAAVEIKKQLTMDYPAYVSYLASADSAMMQLGIIAELSDEAAAEIKNVDPDPVMVKTLVENTRHCLQELGATD